MTPEFPYVQLPGSFRGFFRKASLWEGADHILSVSGTRFNEEYRRFYYRDIQAFIVEKRARAGSVGWWMILLVLLFVFIIATAEDDPPYSWVALVVLSLLAIIRLEITFRRSCRCSIQTAVSREPLPSLIRRRAAETVISRLQSRIAAEQGELPDEIPQQEEDVATALRPPDPAAPSASEVLEQAAARERRSSAVRGVNFAIAALFILLFNSVFTFWVSAGGRQLSPIRASWAGYAFIAIGLIPVCFSLQQIGGLRALQGLRVVLVAMIVLGILRVTVSLAMIPVLAALRPYNAQVLQHYYVNANGLMQLAFAAAGLLLIFAKWETYRRGEPSSH